MSRRPREEDWLPEPELLETPDWMTLEEGLDAIGDDGLRTPRHLKEMD